MKFLRFAIVDRSVPADREAFRRLTHEIVETEIRQQQRIVIVHCMAGLGRTGLFAACALKMAGMGTDEAVEIVRRARPGTIEVEAQMEFVRTF